MKDKRIHHGTMDNSFSEQQICVSVWIFCVMRKIGPILPLLGVLQNRKAVRQNLGEFNFFKILYRLNYSVFYFDEDHCDVTTVL